MEIKTTEEIYRIIQTFYLNENKFQRDKYKGKRWIAVDDLDIYRELCNHFGKAKVWSVNNDELCELIEKMFNGKSAPCLKPESKEKKQQNNGKQLQK